MSISGIQMASGGNDLQFKIRVLSDTVQDRL